MKTIKVISVIITLFILQINMAKAFNGSDETGSSSVVVLDNTRLAPVTPAVADFGDVVPEADNAIQKLQPTTPVEAEFEEVSFVSEMPYATTLSPVTPDEAAFEEVK